MRKKFIYFVVVPLLIVLVLLYFFLDRWVEAGLETAGEAITGAKVEIDHLSLTFSPLGMKWERMQIADANDPWRNLFETGKVQFAMNFGQILRGKYIIETMEVNSFILGTKRTTDGSLPKPPAPKAEAPSATPSFVAQAKEALGKSVEETVPVNFDALRKGVNVDSLVKMLDIRTVKAIDSLTTQATGAAKQWDATLADFESSKKRLADVEASLKAINPSELKQIDKITAAIGTVDNAVKTINELKTTFDTRTASIDADVNRLAGSVAGLDDIARDDLRRLMSMAHLPDLNTTGIARNLVGREMYDRALSYLHWIDVARDMMKKRGKPEKEDPPRMKGQNIRFPVERAYPKFWVQKILLSGGTDSVGTSEYIRARGEARNITDDQTVTRVPLTIDLKGSEGRNRAMSLSALFDRTKDVSYDEYNASLSGVPLAEFQLGNSNFLPSKVTNAKLTSTVKVVVPGDRFDLRARLDFADLAVQFGTEPRNKVESIVRDVLKEVRQFTVNLRMWNTGGRIDVALATDLDEQIASKVKAVLGAEFTKLQNDLKSKLDAKIAEKRREFDKLYQAKRAELDKQLAAYKSLIDQQSAAVNAKSKELVDKLEKEKQGKVDDALKGLFKKK
jgi:uncharacterized protein (TIGR03545 family)